MNYIDEKAARDSDRTLAGHEARRDFRVCQHGLNPAACVECPNDRTTLCAHGNPVALCNKCGEALADTVEDTIEELLG